MIFKIITWKGTVIPFTNKWTETGVERVATGKVTGEEIIQSSFDLYGDERFDRLKYGFVDFTQAESFEITDGEVKAVAYMDKAAAKSNPNLKIAIVAPQDVMNQLANAYATYAEESPWETGVFDTLAQARQWLK